jgi:Tol biopolymer transport system component
MERPDRERESGQIAGTVPYMSPEQVRGEELDARSDIFSLGAVLYEMTTGHQPFVGGTGAEVAREIVKSQPNPVHEQVPSVPIELERIIDKALAPRRGDRYQHTEDLAVDLKRLGRELESGSAPSYGSVFIPVARASGQRWLWTVIAVLAATVVGVLAWQLWPRHDDPEALRTDAGAQVAPIHRQVTFSGTTYLGEFSPDGLSVAYVEKVKDEGLRLMVQDLAGGEPLEILKGKSFSRLRWSPKGTQLLVAMRTGSGERATLLIPRLGGTSRRFNFRPYHAWSPDGLNYASVWQDSKEITIVEIATGGTATLSLSDSLTFLLDIDWSPGGEFLAILAVDEEERYTIWTIPLAGGERKKVIEEDQLIRTLRWSGDGSVIYYLVGSGDTSSLHKVRLDPESGEASTAPTAIMTGMEVGGGGHTKFSLSRDGGRLVYPKVTGQSNLWLLILYAESEGTRVETEQLTSGTFSDSWPSVSPDGDQIAFVRGGDIYTMSLEGGSPQQLTFMEGRESSPAWSPDGSWVAFGSNEGETLRVWKTPARGGSPQPFEKSKVSHDVNVTWAPGSQILYQRPGNRNFHLLDPETEEEAPLVKDESVGWVFFPKYSPDGAQVAVNWHRRQPEGNQKQNLWTISLADSSEIRVFDDTVWPLGWSADGEWVYALDRWTKPYRVIRILATGGEAETVFEWPFEGKNGTCVMGSNESQWVCTVGESSSDIWLVENFDPDMN